MISMSEVRTDLNEEVIEPQLPIIDSHHHLWVHPHERPIDEFRAELASGHNVQAIVYVECRARYLTNGPASLRPVGEAAFVADVGSRSHEGLFGSTRVCAAFVGAADLAMGSDVDGVLEALGVASGRRLRGIRGTAIWDADVSVNTSDRQFAPRGLLLSSRFRAGFARLVERKLVYDALQYHPQLPDVCSLADAFPGATIVVNHCGGLLGVGSYARPDTFARWRALVTAAAQRTNIVMKLGGLGMRRCGFGFDTRPVPATVEELALIWRPYIETCIELFGPGRCMFESNFPPDNVAGSYRAVWNVFKTITSGFSSAEKHDLFSGTAARIYGIH
jgi:predicted TIM-barrel fold metal-dependent hydrolase